VWMRWPPAARQPQPAGQGGHNGTQVLHFYKKRLIEGGAEVLLPSAEDMAEVNRVIFEELCYGKIAPSSKANFLRIIEDFRSRGAQGAILGCTEIGMLVSQADTDIRLFETTQIHSDAAVEAALS